MTVKDWITVTIAVVSLLISISTFTLNRVEASRARDVKNAKAAYNAYQLGKRFATSFLVYTQTREGDPAEVAKAKAEALHAARVAQAYADSLDLKFDIAEVIAKYRLGESVIGEGVTEMLESRLRAEHGPEITGNFVLGFWLVWLHFQAQAVAEVHPGYAPTFEKDYPRVAAVINEQLSRLAVGERITATMPAVQVTTSETIMIKDLVETMLDAGAR